MKGIALLEDFFISIMIQDHESFMKISKLLIFYSDGQMNPKSRRFWHVLNM